MERARSPCKERRNSVTSDRMSTALAPVSRRAWWLMRPSSSIENLAQRSLKVWRSRASEGRFDEALRALAKEAGLELTFSMSTALLELK